MNIYDTLIHRLMDRGSEGISDREVHDIGGHRAVDAIQALVLEGTATRVENAFGTVFVSTEHA